MKMETELAIDMNADLEVKTPPKRTDTVREGLPVEKATAEAHGRESRVEEATHREEVEKKWAPLPGVPEEEEGEAAGEGRE